jgi:hypothetical protein
MKTTYMPVINPALPTVLTSSATCCKALALNNKTPIPTLCHIACFESWMRKRNKTQQQQSGTQKSQTDDRKGAQRSGRQLLRRECAAPDECNHEHQGIDFDSLNYAGLFHI